MQIDFTSPDYLAYKKIQCDAHNSYRHEDKNHNKEGHRFDISNIILMDMVKNLNLKAPLTALDLGCAEGFHTEQLKEMFGTAYGVDINKESLDYAHQHGRDYCSEGDIHKIPFENEKFDLVFSHEVLEHAIDFNLALSECNRVLKPKGYLVFSVPNENPNDKYVREENGGHFSIMTPFKVKEHLINAGFEIIDGYVFNIPVYNYTMTWSDSDINYPFPYPHLHCIVQKS